MGKLHLGAQNPPEPGGKGAAEKTKGFAVVVATSAGLPGFGRSEMPGGGHTYLRRHSWCSPGGKEGRGVSVEVSFLLLQAPGWSQGVHECHPSPDVSWAAHSHCSPCKGLSHSLPQFPPLQEAIGAVLCVPRGVIYAASLPCPSGHVFNMPHDNVKACEEVFGRLKTNHMMSPTLIQIDRANPWSACSAAIITDFLDSGHGEPSCTPHLLTCAPTPREEDSFLGLVPGRGW